MLVSSVWGVTMNVRSENQISWSWSYGYSPATRRGCWKLNFGPLKARSAPNHGAISAARVIWWWKHFHHCWPRKSDTTMTPSVEERAEKHRVMKNVWASEQSPTAYYGCEQSEHAAKGRFLNSKKWNFDLRGATSCASCAVLRPAFWRTSGTGRHLSHSRSSGFLPEADTLVKAVWLIVICAKLSSSRPAECSSKHLQFYNYHLEAQSAS